MTNTLAAGGIMNPLGTIASLGSTIAPIAIYTVASFVIASTREIIKNAQLNIMEYNRLVELNNEMVDLIRSQRETLIEQISNYQEKYRKPMERLLEEFDVKILSETDVDAAVYAMVEYADQAGMALQYANYDEFLKAMGSGEIFTLE